jgi:endonuclease/exonuclease/phosphatase family metal-dependent hydrolase
VPVVPEAAASVARLVTYNVHRCLGPDGELSPRRIAEVIASLEPDIVALQELDVRRGRTKGVDQAAVIANQLGMTMHFHAAVKVMEEESGDAILTTKTCRLVKTGHLRGRSLIPNREPRGVLWAAIEIGDGTLQLVNTHLGVTGRERITQVETLLGPQWLGHPDCRDPVILAGDFNALLHGRTCRLLAAKLGGSESADLLDGNVATFPSRVPVLGIDHVFASPSVELLGAEVIRTTLARMASDHLPLTVNFRLRNSARLAGQTRAASSISNHN